MVRQEPLRSRDERRELSRTFIDRRTTTKTATIPTATQAAPLKIATFDVDVSPPIGAPVAYVAARSIVDPLSARGIILFGEGKPVVLCAVDFLGIGNTAYEVQLDVRKQVIAEQNARTVADTLEIVKVESGKGLS